MELGEGVAFICEMVMVGIFCFVALYLIDEFFDPREEDV